MDPDLGTELFESLGLDALLPESLSAWRPLLLEGMAFFLDRLPEARLGAIVAEQLALAASVSAARATALLARCPTLHKLGQVVARQPGLDAELRRHLQALESLPASTDGGALHRPHPRRARRWPRPPPRRPRARRRQRGRGAALLVAAGRAQP